AEAGEVMSAVRRACKAFNSQITVVTAGYADYRRFGGLGPEALVDAAKISRSDVVMVDTAIKDGATLLDNMPEAELADFIALAHEAELEVALAGSVGAEHLPVLFEVGADIVGVRGAVCGAGDRNTAIEVGAVRRFMAAVDAQRRAAAPTTVSVAGHSARPRSF
ncbi:MAG: (5-formylfuran-3-yl)methyl phosphate synthase, partial [Pseudomonadota bacterium]